VYEGLELKLASGVKLGIADDEGNKVIRFNQPVKVVALTLDEASRVGVTLNRSRRLVILPTLIDLVETGFLDKPKSLPQIREELTKLNIKMKGSSLPMALNGLARKHVLIRNGKLGFYTYRKA
jgi:hypothetical protein